MAASFAARSELRPEHGLVMRTYTFEPKFSVVHEVQPVWQIADLERERGVYSATPAFVREHCGDIARLLLSHVPDEWYADTEKLGLYPNCDVRIHRLYPAYAVLSTSHAEPIAGPPKLGLARPGALRSIYCMASSRRSSRKGTARNRHLRIETYVKKYSARQLAGMLVTAEDMFDKAAADAGRALRALSQARSTDPDPARGM